MTKITVRATLVIAFLGVVALLMRLYPGETSASANVTLAPPSPASDPVKLASPGRIEGKSETVEVGAAIDGVVQMILVREGQHVGQGQPLAEIACEDLRSAYKVTLAEAESLRQTRNRLVRGSREEERQAAAQQTAAARAVLEQTRAQLDRMAKLRDAQAISKAAYEQALRDFEVADAELKRAGRNEELVNAGPLPEELNRADADIHAAEDRMKLADDKLQKCVVRAPLSGTILRVNLRQGESFALLSPRPLFSLADISGRRVRAEVDERDVAKVRLGQKVTVSCDAYPGKRFTGTVTRVAPVMGNKSVRTGDPSDKADRDVLEVYAALEAGASALPIGLRTTVQFLN